MSEDRLLVPIAVEAFRANNTNEAYKKAGKVSPAYSKLNYTVLGGNVETPPFSKEAPLKKGVHLHFILPDGLTAGKETETGFMYPNVPNRWMVTRIERDTANIKSPAVNCKSWIIESDYVGTDNKTSVRVPTLDDPAKPCKYLGRCYEAGEEPAKGHYLDNFTVFGSGDPAFSAYYPSCRSVLGFHDSLDDLDEANLTYLVLGWYSDSKKDPLYGATEKDLDSRLSALNWEAAKGALFADQILCHGMVCSVEWKGEDYDYPTNKPQGAVDVSVGNNSKEALSALIARKVEGRGKANGMELERFLNALQYDVLEKFDELDGIVKVEDTIHNRTFASEGFCTSWSLVPDEGVSEKERPKLTEEALLLLYHLNETQREKDEYDLSGQAVKEKLYVVWYDYFSKYEDPPTMDEKPQKKEMKGEFDKQRKKLTAILKLLKGAGEEVLSLKGDIQDYLKEKALPYHLEATEAEAFHRPADPVFVLSGDGIKRSYAFGEDGRFSDHNVLICRGPGQTVNGLCANVEGSGASLTNDDVESYVTEDFATEAAPSGAEDLFFEALYMEPDSAELLAIAAYKKIKKTYKKEHISRLAEEIRKLITVPFNGVLYPEYDVQQIAGSVGFSGLIPSKVAVNLQNGTWHSLFLEWELCYYPTKTNRKQDDSMKRWSFTGIDYEYEGGFPIPKILSAFQGRTVLTPHPQLLLKEALQKQMERYAEDEPLYQKLQKTLDLLGHLNVLAQSAGGLTDKLIGKNYSLQFPFMITSDELKSDADAVSMTTDLATLLRDKDLFSPFTGDEIFPVRSGFFKITKIQILNTFGIAQTVFTGLDDMILAETMRPKNSFKGAGVLPPKIAQSSMVRFDWKPVLESSASPICGYIIPNLLNRGLMVYDADGEMKGSLQLTYEKEGGGFQTGAAWISAPLSGYATFEETNFSNAYLRSFVKALLDYAGRGVEALRELLSFLDEMQSGTLAEAVTHGQDLSILCGRPIALARAAVSLNLKESPAYHMDLSNFAKYDSDKFEKIKFPVALGDAARKTDGLLGYFLDDDTDNVYEKLYAADGAAPPLGEASGYVEYRETVEIDFSEDNLAELTVLLEPMTDLTIRTGILPVKKVKLEDYLVKEAIGRMYRSFEVNPVITSMEQFSIPLFTEEAKGFSFAYRDKNQTFLEKKEITEEAVTFAADEQIILDGYLIKKEVQQL